MNQKTFARDTRNTLRTLQARRRIDDGRIDMAIIEIILEITWRVAEKIQGERLPR